MKKRTSQAPCLFGLGCKHTDIGGNSAGMISPLREPVRSGSLFRHLLGPFSGQPELRAGWPG